METKYLIKTNVRRKIIPIVKRWMPFIKVLSPSRIHESVKEEARSFWRCKS